MTTDLLIEPQTIKLTSIFSSPFTLRRYKLDTDNLHMKDLKIWTTIAKDTRGNTIIPLSRTQGNELSRSMKLSTIGYFSFWIDENFNLLIADTENKRPEDYRPFDFYKNWSDNYGNTLNRFLYYGISAEELEQVKKIHKSLIDAVVNIKVFHPQLIVTNQGATGYRY